jgi:hypothetical protein
MDGIKKIKMKNIKNSEIAEELKRSMRERNNEIRSNKEWKKIRKQINIPQL